MEPMLGARTLPGAGDDPGFMADALAEARDAAAHDDVPIGAVVVRDVLAPERDPVRAWEARTPGGAQPRSTRSNAVARSTSHAGVGSPTVASTRLRGPWRGLKIHSHTSA